MSGIRQPSFLGGELDPLLWGRTDLALYSKGARRMRNFFVSKQGSAVSRPGSVYLGQCKSQAVEPNVRLVPFTYSDDVSYVLEVGSAPGITNVFGSTPESLYVRFFRNGAAVTATYLKYDALGATFDTGSDTELFGSSSLTHARIISNHLDVRGTAGVLQIAIISGPGFTDNEPLSNLSGAGAATADGASFTSTLEVRLEGSPILAVPPPFVWDLSPLKWAQTGASIILTHPHFYPIELIRVDADEWTMGSVDFTNPTPYFDQDNPPTIRSPLPTVDATHPEQQWDFLVTLVVRDNATGKRFETLGWRITHSWVDDITIATVALAAGQKYAIYPDRVLTIDTSAHVPLDVLNVVDTSYTVESVNYYRGQGNEMGWIGSTELFGEFVDIGNIPDYVFPPPRGTNPLIVDTGYMYPYAVAYFQERLAFGGTVEMPGAAWFSETGDYRNFDLPLVTHHAGESLLYEIAARQFEEIAHLLPDSKLLVLTGGSVWSMSGQQGQALDFDSVDVRLEDSVGSGHLPPLKVEGSILFGRKKGFGVRALIFNGQSYSGLDASIHSQHLFLGETVVNGTAYDKALVDWTFAEDPWGIVWACRGDGTLLSLQHVGDNYCWSRHDCDDARFLRVCAVPETTEDAVYMIVQRTLNGIPVNCVERQASRVQRGNQGDDCAVDCAVKYTAAPAVGASVTGLDHLEGKSVWAVGRLNTPIQRTVSGGAITLASPVANNAAETTVTLYVGLQYEPELETTDAVTSDTRLKKRVVERIGVELDQCTGVYFGSSFDDEDLRTSRPPAEAAHGYLAEDREQTGLVSFAVQGKWSEAGRACIRQTLPLPVTVVAIVRDIKFGD